MATLERRVPPQSSERSEVEAQVRRCLGSARGTWRVTTTSLPALAHWWRVEVARAEDGLRQELFVDASREVRREVCRRVTEAGLVAPAAPAPCEPPAREAGEARPRVELEFDGSLSPELKRRFEWPLVRALEDRPGRYRLSVGPGRRPDEVLVVIHAGSRVSALPLFFPRAGRLEPFEVLRIVGNTLESMGPAAP